MKKRERRRRKNRRERRKRKGERGEEGEGGKGRGGGSLSGVRRKDRDISQVFSVVSGEPAQGQFPFSSCGFSC